MREDVFYNASQSLWGCSHGLHFLFLRVEDHFKEAFVAPWFCSESHRFIWCSVSKYCACVSFENIKKKKSKEFFMLEFFFHSM